MSGAGDSQNKAGVWGRQPPGGGGDGHANQGSGHLQPGFRPEPKIVYIWGLIGPDRPPNPAKKVEGPPHFCKGLEVDRAHLPPKYKRFVSSGLNPGCRWLEPWLARPSPEGEHQYGICLRGKRFGTQGSDCPPKYGKAFDTETRRGGVPEFLWVFLVSGPFLRFSAGVPLSRP